MCCAQQTGVHEMVVEALVVIYLFYLGSELILIDIRNLFGRVPVSCDIAGPCPTVSFSSWSIPAVVYEPANHHRNAACTQQYAERLRCPRCFPVGISTLPNPQAHVTPHHLCSARLSLFTRRGTAKTHLTKNRQLYEGPKRSPPKPGVLNL
jgi:hypothetical protein